MKQPPFGMMPMFMPMPMQGSADHNERAYDLVVPARIGKAMEFLAHLHHKQMIRAAVFEMGVEQIPGVDLCAEEEATRDAALKCLSDYFDGKLKPDQWEGLKYDVQKKAAEKHLGATAQPSAQVMQGAVLSCPKCEAPGNQSCKYCHGLGQVMVSPIPSAGAGLGDIISSLFGLGGVSSPPEEPEDDAEEGE